MGRNIHAESIQARPRPRRVRVPSKHIGKEARRALESQDKAQQVVATAVATEKPAPKSMPLLVRKPKRGWHVHHCRVLTCKGEPDMFGYVTAVDSNGDEYLVHPSKGHGIIKGEFAWDYDKLNYQERITHQLQEGMKILEVGLSGGSQVKRFVTRDTYFQAATAASF